MTAAQTTQLRALTGSATDCALMAHLQDRGLVSDLAVNPDDVAESDAERAISQLTQHQ